MGIFSSVKHSEGGGRQTPSCACNRCFPPLGEAMQQQQMLKAANQGERESRRDFVLSRRRAGGVQACGSRAFWVIDIVISRRGICRVCVCVCFGRYGTAFRYGFNRKFSFIADQKFVEILALFVVVRMLVQWQGFQSVLIESVIFYFFFFFWNVDTN